MDNFTYKDTFHAALAACLPCFMSPSNTPSYPSNSANSRSNATASNDLECLLRDTDSDALSLHSNFGASPGHRGRRRRRPKFSLTLFGFTLFGRPPIYLSDDEDDGLEGRNRTSSSWTLDSDAAPLDSAAIERLSSPDHRTAVQSASEARKKYEEEERARHKAERKLSRKMRSAREHPSALLSLSSVMDAEVGDLRGGDPTLSPLPVQGAEMISIGDASSNMVDADNADLGGESYLRSSGPIGSRSGSTSDSHTSASFSPGDAIQAQDSVPYASHTMSYSPTEMQLPPFPKKKSHRTSRRNSLLSSSTASQSTSNTPHTPPTQVKHVFDSPRYFPERDDVINHDGATKDFPITGLSRGSRPKDGRAFLSNKNGS